VSLYGIISKHYSGRLSCKVENLMKTCQTFSLKKDKAFIKILYLIKTCGRRIFINSFLGKLETVRIEKLQLKQHETGTTVMIILRNA